MWDDEFSVGSTELDAQHQHILELIRAMADAHDGGGADTADVVLQHITRYLGWHFETEEHMMQASGYPLLEEHRAEHEACLTTIAEYNAEFQRNSRVDLSAVANYLTQWLHQHLLDSDRKYMLYVRNQAPTA